VRPLEVCALRLNPYTSSTTPRAPPQQQSTTASINSKSARSKSTALGGTSGAIKFDLSLPLSDSDEDGGNTDETSETIEYHSASTDKMSTDGSTTTVTEASCPILSVRIEFCKPRTKNDTDNEMPTTMKTDSDCSSSGDGGVRRRLAARSTHKTKNAKTTIKPLSPSKAISVAGRGKVVVIDDGVYDQFARRQPPKYLSSRTFDTMVGKRALSK